MAKAGGRAPSFHLRGLEGGEHSLDSLLEGGQLILAFFKISCPTCQLAFPFLQRAAAKGVRIFGISQDDEASTELFRRRLGFTFPVLLDNSDGGYPSSNAYGLRNVPTLFIVSSRGVIEERIEGFHKAAYAAFGVPFDASDKVPLLQPG